jgi:hypothetical protein
MRGTRASTLPVPPRNTLTNVGRYTISLFKE